LQALREIRALPDAVGAHACECRHPEMGRLPDGVCLACGLEVLPISPRPGRSQQQSIHTPQLQRASGLSPGVGRALRI
jgi:hypothetical protein